MVRFMKTKKQNALGIRISDTFHEQERKLNASSVAHLVKIQDFVIADAHYVTLNDPRFAGDWLSDMPLHVPQSNSDLRFRHYFDDPKLTANRAGIELRVEYRGDKSADGWPYKQVIKVGASGSEEDHTLDRLEYPAKLRRGLPVLEAVEGAGASFLKAAFNKNKLADVQLFPLIQIVSQRWKLLYHPDGDKDTQIELSTDMARARAFTGFTWDLFQVELELKKGDPQILADEEARLRKIFRCLTVETRSKPAPGFDHLTGILDKKPMRDFVRTNLSQGRFRVYPELQNLLP